LIRVGREMQSLGDDVESRRGGFCVFVAFVLRRERERSAAAYGSNSPSRPRVSGHLRAKDAQRRDRRAVFTHRAPHGGLGQRHETPSALFSRGNSSPLDAIVTLATERVFRREGGPRSSHANRPHGRGAFPPASPRVVEVSLRVRSGEVRASNRGRVAHGALDSLPVARHRDVRAWDDVDEASFGRGSMSGGARAPLSNPRAHLDERGDAHELGRGSFCFERRRALGGGDPLVEFLADRGSTTGRRAGNGRGGERRGSDGNRVDAILLKFARHLQGLEVARRPTRARATGDGTFRHSRNR